MTRKLPVGLKKRSFGSALFNIAHAFARASDSSWEAISRSSDADFAAPAVMCQSFSIELLLKFFISAGHPSRNSYADLVAAGVDLRGHKFTALFDRIAPSHQERIAHHFSKADGPPKTTSDFRNALITLGDDPFVQWRYVYEKAESSWMDKVLLDRVTDALGNAAAEVRAAQTAILRQP